MPARSTLHFNVMLNGALLARGPLRPVNPDAPPGTGFARFTKAVELADELGFDGVWMGNSYALNGPETFLMLAHVVSISERLRIGTSVFLLPMRHPTTVAYEVATLDQLSNGRLLFGVGVGGDRPVDFTLHGMAPRERGARMDESLDVIRKLWSGEDVQHHGRFYNVEGRLRIRPAQDPMPVLIGARGGTAPQQQRAYHRIVERAQGWLPYVMTPSGFARGLESIRGLGGNPDALTLGLVERTYVGDGDGMVNVAYAAQNTYSAAPERARSLVLAGNREMVIDRMNQFADLGVTEFVFMWACPPAEVENQMHILAADIIPAVRAHAAQRTAAH